MNHMFCATATVQNADPAAKAGHREWGRTMAGSSSAKSEFLKWVASLAQDALTNHEKTLLHLVINNFDELAALGTAGGRRATRLGQIITANGASITADMPTIELEALKAPEEIRKLIDVTIGPFRGFTRSETFGLERPYAFMYGPNGSGKSSFCEGLEYALIGSIAEAEAKRISVQDYVRNAHAGSSALPKVRALFASGDIGEVQPSRGYRFSFVEKNRIDDFARMSATTEKVQSERIAALFGLEHFTAFVNGFTNNLDHRYLQIENQHAAAVDAQKLSIQQLSEKLVVKKSELDALPGEVAKLVADCGLPAEAGLAEVRVFLRGTDGNTHRVQTLLNARATPVSQDLDPAPLERALLALARCKDDADKLGEMNVQLAANAGAVNFKNLVQVIQAIGASSDADLSRCPACNTPVAQSETDPFKQAETELKRMEALSHLQAQIAIVTKALGGLIAKLNQELAIIDVIRLKLDSQAKPCPRVEVGLNGEGSRNRSLEEATRRGTRDGRVAFQDVLRIATGDRSI